MFKAFRIILVILNKIGTMYSLIITGLLIFIFSIKLPASLNVIFSAGIKIEYSAGNDCT